MYVILLILGLSVGAVFLIALLIGDKREAQRKTLQDQITAASEPLEGVWPSPIDASALPKIVQANPATQPRRASGTSRKVVRTFYWIRGYVAGTALVAYIIYSSFPKLNFGWVLLATALAFVALAMGIAAFKKSRQSSKRLSSDLNETKIL